jgi:hypothetical protein
MSHTRKLSEKAKDQMKQFYKSQPDFKDISERSDYYYDLVMKKRQSPPTTILFKQKKLKHYPQIENTEKPVKKLSNSI